MTLDTLPPNEASATEPSVRRSFSALASDAMLVLYQHRMMTTDQLHRLLAPAAQRPTWLRTQLRVLCEHGLAARIRAQSPRVGPPAERSKWAMQREQYLWYLTEAGCEAVESGGEVLPRAYRVTDEAVAGPRQRHTLAVNEAGIAFALHAARLGDECGPLDWTPEVAHRIRDAQRRLADDHVISDAVLHYVRVDGASRTLLTVFLEVDRTTMTTARLAAKLAAYGRLFEFVPQHAIPARRSAARTRPGWQDLYPAFPRLLVVLDANESRTRAARLAARTEDLYALTRANPQLARLAGRLSMGVTTLDLLREHGPFEPIFTPLLRGTPEQRPGLTDMLLAADADDSTGRTRP